MKKPPFNNNAIQESYIKNECIICSRKIQEDERKKIISLKVCQTWCLLCIVKRHPNNKIIHNLIDNR